MKIPDQAQRARRSKRRGSITEAANGASPVQNARQRVKAAFTRADVAEAAARDAEMTGELSETNADLFARIESGEFAREALAKRYGPALLEELKNPTGE